jgi:D-xylose transport system substrate-binding protein
MDSHVDDRWALDQKYFVEKAGDLGAVVLVEIAQGDATRQLDQAKKLLENGVKSLVIVAVNSTKAVEIVNMAKSYDVSVLSYDRLILSEGIGMYVSYDNIKVGRLQAQSAIDNAGNGNYLLINGPVSDYNAVSFRDGQMDVLQPLIDQGKITITEDIILDSWGEVNAFVALLGISTINDVDAIIAANDAIALAVASAVDDVESLKNIYLTGQDADLSSINSIVKGYQNMTVYKPIATLAETAAEIAVKMANGEQLEAPVLEMGGIKVRAILLDPQVVTKDNIKETVVADGHVKMSELVEN